MAFPISNQPPVTLSARLLHRHLPAACFLLGALLTLCLLALARVAAAPSDTLTMLYTGDTRGRVEPCGCSEGILGGLPRRATMLKRLKAGSPSAVILEAGSLLGKSSDVLKVPLMVKCLKQMGYTAANLGAADSRWRNRLASEMERAGLAGVSFDLPGGVVTRGRVVTAGGLRLGLTGISRCPTSTNRKAFQATLASLRGKCDLVVILSAAPPADNLRLLKDLGRPSRDPLSLEGEARLRGGRIERNPGEAPRPHPRPAGRGYGLPPVILIGPTLGKPQLLRTGSAYLAPVTPEGGHVGRVRLTLGNDWSITSAVLDLFPLGDAVPDDLPTLQAVQAYYDQVAEELLAKKGAASVEAGYALASSCAYCHGDIHRKWQRLPHARAVADLKRVGRDLAPDCLQCHSEYFRRTGKAPVQPEQRMGVECASCHGEGFMLILRPSKMAAAAKPDAKVCTSCHTRERSPHFNFAAYKRKIRHW